jgi:4-aminobutyrate aminotransferase
LTPPLTLTRNEAQAGLELLDRALADVAGGRVDPRLLQSFQGW